MKKQKDYLNIVIKTIISILVVIIIYAVLGFAALIWGATVYDRIPDTNLTIISSLDSQLILKNNAPFSFPFVNPLFSGGIRIINSTGNITCRLGGHNCENKSIDIGYISAGESKEIIFSITPYGNNFTISLDAYINIFKSFLIESKTIECKGTKSVRGQLIYKCS